MAAGRVIEILVEPLPGDGDALSPEAVRELRTLLKRLLRVHRLRAVSVRPLAPDAADAALVQVVGHPDP